MSDASSTSPAARRLLVGAVTNWLAFAATLLVGFFLTPYLVRRLGDGPYGVWAFVESVLAYFTLFDLGIAACVVRFVARFHATGTVLILEHRPSLLALGVLITACNLVEHATLAGLAFRALPTMRFSRRLVDRATLKRVKGYSLDAFLAMVAGRACVQSGAVIVGAYLGAAPVTYLALAARLVEFAKALLRTATNTLTPAISSLEAAGDTAAIRRVFLRGTRWVLYLILPVHLGLVVFGRPFLAKWLGGPEYADKCYPALVVLSS